MGNANAVRGGMVAVALLRQILDAAERGNVARLVMLRGDLDTALDEVAFWADAERSE